jgi:hypothetical protein
MVGEAGSNVFLGIVEGYRSSNGEFIAYVSTLKADS